jgi:hypothetical protein
MKTIFKTSWIFMGLMGLSAGTGITAVSASEDTLIDMSRKLIEAAKSNDYRAINDLEAAIKARREKKYQSADFEKAQKEVDRLVVQAEILKALKEDDIKTLLKKTQELHAANQNTCGRDGVTPKKQTVDAKVLLNVEVNYDAETCEEMKAWDQRLTISEKALAELVAGNAVLKKAYEGLSDSEKKTALSSLEEELNKDNLRFGKELKDEDFEAIASGKENLLAAPIHAQAQKILVTMGADGKDPTLPMSAAKAKLRSVFTGEENHRREIEEREALLVKAKELLKSDSLAKIENPCDLLKDSVAWDSLSAAEQEACKDKKGSFKRNLAVAKADADAIPVDPDSKEKEKEEEGRRDRSERKVAGKDGDEDRRVINREAADQLAAARQTNEFLAAKNIINQLALECERTSLNAAMPFGANNLQIAKLDKLADGFMAETTSCTTSSFAGSELGAFGATADGQYLAEEALSEIYPRGAVGLSAEEANELPKERKCLSRGMQASKRKLEAAEYYIRQHSWKLAQLELMQLLKRDPQAVARKQQEMMMMGDMRNPMLALRDEIQNAKIEELEAFYDVAKMRRDHKVFTTLFSGVSQLYSARTEYINASNLAAAEDNSNKLPVSAASSGKRLAPSRSPGTSSSPRPSL